MPYKSRQDRANYMREYRKRQPPSGKDPYKAKYLEVVAEVERLNEAGQHERIAEAKVCRFISQYRGIIYNIPSLVDAKGNSVMARFVDGEYTTVDERIATYLRGHQDYGITLTEM